jgi:hypothetical protein
MSVTRNLPRSRALLRRGHRRHRAVIASATLAAVTLSVGCGGSQTYAKHIQHALGHGTSQQAQTLTT